MNGSDPIWTVGHSNRPLGAFVALLETHRIARIVDVRTLPRSRRNPWFDRESLRATLAALAIDYRHMPDLGGLRHPRADSHNTGWHDRGLRGYADHMQTPAFATALVTLIALAEHDRTAVLCAEADPSRCHRSLLADALLARGLEVRHVKSPDHVDPHRLTVFARVAGTVVTYPGTDRLF